jgi:hypothetical protein
MDRTQTRLSLWDAFHEVVSAGCEAERFADRIEAKATHPDRSAMLLTKEDQNALRRLENQVRKIQGTLPLEDVIQHMPGIRGELICIALDTLQTYLERLERERLGDIGYGSAYRRVLEIQRGIAAVLQNAAGVAKQWSEDRDGEA